MSCRCSIRGKVQQSKSRSGYSRGIPSFLAVGGSPDRKRLVVALRPLHNSVFHIGERGTLEKRREDTMVKVRGASGRGQKGRGCQLNSTPNAKPTFLHKKRCLDPGRIVRTKVNISNRAIIDLLASHHTVQGRS